MHDIQTSIIPQVTVGEMTELLTNAYEKLIENGIPFADFPSVMLWGPPGVGKSQGVKEIARTLEEHTGKRVKVTDVRLLLFNPIDLRGIPTANADKTLAVWLKPQIFQMDESDQVINILFLDEISAAPQTVQAAAYQITLDRVVGEHKLPDNCIVIAAGNRVTDKSVAVKMPKALANRLCHFEIESDFESWRAWAVQKQVNDKVIGFLSFRSDYLMGFDAKTDDLAFATPRSWEMVSNALNAISDDVDSLYPIIAGLVGTGTAVEFRTWCNVYHKLPQIEDVFSGKASLVPKKPDELYALVSSMVSYARKHFDDMDKLSHSIAYASKLPTDFALLLIRDYLAVDNDSKKKLLAVPGFVQLLQKCGGTLNGLY